jgi:hypothetical protein
MDAWSRGLECELGPTLLNRAFPELVEKVKHHTTSPPSPSAISKGYTCYLLA